MASSSLLGHPKSCPFGHFSYSDHAAYPHQAPTLGRSICRWASHLGHSSSRCRVEPSFCPHLHWFDSAKFRRYKYFRIRLWSVRSWIGMTDSWVLSLLYSLRVCLCGRAPSSFFCINTPTVEFFSKCGIHSAWIRFWLISVLLPISHRCKHLMQQFSDSSLDCLYASYRLFKDWGRDEKTNTFSNLCSHHTWHVIELYAFKDLVEAKFFSAHIRPQARELLHAVDLFVEVFSRGVRGAWLHIRAGVAKMRGAKLMMSDDFGVGDRLPYCGPE